MLIENTSASSFFFEVIVYVMLPLYTIAIIVLILIIWYYSQKSINNEAKSKKIEKKVEKFLSKFIFGEAQSIDVLILEIKKFKKTIPFDENFVKKIILDKIFTISEVFKLDKSDILVILFHEFEFLNYAQTLIASRKWYNKALGIYFLEKINYTTEIRLIEPSLNHKNSTLRSLSFLAMLALKDNVFDLLVNYKENISFASKIKIANILTNKNTVFSANEVNILLQHDNESIKSVVMLYVLKKNIVVDEKIILNLLNSKSQHIRRDVVSLIRNLKLTALENKIISSYKKELIIRNKISIFKTLAEMGSEKSILFALKTLKDPDIDPDIEFEAVKVIYKLNPTFFQQFIISKFSEKDTVSKIIAHINCPYL